MAVPRILRFRCFLLWAAVLTCRFITWNKAASIGRFRTSPPINSSRHGREAAERDQGHGAPRCLRTLAARAPPPAESAHSNPAPSQLKRRQSVDRSAPLVDDAAHPGSGGVLRAISAGHFDLKHVEAEHDASAPILEQGTGFHTDVRPAVFADIQKPGKRASLKETNTNDRSAPVIEKFPMDIKKPPPRKIVVDELKEKKNVIDAMHQHNELHTKSEIEKHTRPGETRSPHPPARVRGHPVPCSRSVTSPVCCCSAPRLTRAHVGAAWARRSDVGDEELQGIH